MSEHCRLLLCDDLERSCTGCPQYKEGNAASVKMRKELDAKKRLMAAAPALLEACEEWKAEWISGESAASWYEQWPKAEAAIVAATK